MFCANKLICVKCFLQRHNSTQNRPKKNTPSDFFAEYPSDLNGNQESDKLKSVTKCYTHIETSSNSADIDKMTNGETSSFWQSDGSARSHWIRWGLGLGAGTPWVDSLSDNRWVGCCGGLILAGCQVPPRLLHESPPQLGRGEKK